MYQLRGNRVAPISEAEIANTAANLCALLNLSSPSGRKKKQYDKALEKLSIYSVTLDPIDDDEWIERTYNLTVGHYDPRTLTISIPNKIYVQACQGEKYSLSVILHEIGHLVLGHQAQLHFSTALPTQVEDAEWQADLFADYALQYMGFNSRQLCFDFY